MMLALLFGGRSELIGQCAVESLYGEPIFIRDNDTLRVRIRIDGARFNLLGQDDFQGICGVRISFNHRNVSDLSMTLASPNGSEVILIGPATGNGTIPSLFPVEHDIIFRNEETFVTPDPGFDNTWTNENINWAQGPYQGEYYPFGGELIADFAGSTVDGIWELVIADAFINDEGLFRSFELIFCEDLGINCSPCESRTGLFSTPSVGLCRGELLPLDTLYTSDNFNPTLYRDDFLVYRNDTLVAITDSPDLSIYQDGQVFIYGMNTLNEDYDSLTFGIFDIPREIWIDSINSPGGVFCADISSPLIVDISTPVDSIAPPIVLCQGDSVLFDGRYLSETGTYTQRIGGCDTLVTVEILASDLVLSGLPDSLFLDCNVNSVSINGLTASTNSVNYTWYDATNNIVSDTSTIQIAATGTYRLDADDGVCLNSHVLQVYDPRDTMVLDIIASTLDLNCVDTLSKLYISTNYEYDSIVWTRTGDIISQSDTITVSEGGNYAVLVYGSNGCTDMHEVIISQDDRLSFVDLVVDTITCADPFAEFRITVTGPPAIDVLWRNSAGDSIDRTSKATLSEVGMYSVLMINDNLCDTLINFELLADSSTLDIVGIPDTAVLNCDIRRLDLQVGTNSGGLLSSYWLSPSLDTVSRTTQLTVTTPGLYTAGIIGASGCPAEQVVTVVMDTISPTAIVDAGVIDCNNPSSTITATTTFDNVAYAWAGIVDSTLSVNQIQTSTAGLISLAVLDTTNGCFTIDTISVREDFAEPNIILAGPERLTCTIPVINIENVSTEMVTGFWLNPNMDTVRQNVIEVTTPGEYQYVGFGANGCSRSGTKLVTDDRDGPMINLPTEINFDCSNLTTSIVIADTMGATLSWVVNGDTTTSNDIAIINTSQVTSIAVGSNGCEVVQLIPVNYDTLTPDIEVPLDSLNCLDTSVILTNLQDVRDYEYSWTTIDGVVTDRAIEISRPQNIQLRVTDTRNQCISQADLVVLIDTISPSLTIASDGNSLTCDLSIITAVANYEDGNRLGWLSAMPIPDEDTLTITSPGLYTATVEGKNGCSSTQTLLINSDIARPDISVSNTFQLDCNNPRIVINPDHNTPNLSLSWTTASGTIIADSFLLSEPGTLTLVATSDNGCDTTVLITSSIDTITPIADVMTTDTVICDGSAIEILASSSSSSDYVVTWTADGTPIAGTDNTVIIAESAQVVYSVVDTSNGCIAIDSVNVDIAVTPLTGITYSVNDESCLGDGDGMIGMIAAVGGEGSSTIMLDGETISGDMTAVGVGDHVISAMDKLGCLFSETFVVEAGADFAVSIPGNIEVFRGDEVTITPTYTGGIPIAASWQTGEGVFADVDSLSLLPTIDQEVILTAISPEGCASIDTTFIDVKTDFSRISVYVPDILVPSSQAGNDQLVIQLTEDIASLDYFAIYDRWGQKVVFIENLVGPTPVVIWDGRFQGAEVSSGVYVYLYQITTSEEGRRKTVGGDITVIR